MCQTTFAAPAPQVNEFGERLAEIYNSAGLGFMLSIGHRTGLFDVMSEGESWTAEELARAAGKNERYVREWLAAVTVGGIVAFDDGTERYHLPGSHAALLTRAAAPNNFAVTSQFFAALGAVESDVVECFEKGGGVPYERFPRFHEIMAEESGQTVVAALHASILPLVPGIEERLEKGIDVLDIGCGRGLALQSMAEKYPRSRFYGLDLCENAALAARARVNEAGLRNIEFEVGDAAELRRECGYDLVTAFDAIHDQARPDLVLGAIHRALRPGAVFLMQDIDGRSKVADNREHPLGPFLYTISTMHCMTVSLANGGMGLGTLWGREKAQEMLQAAGFDQVRIETLEHDTQNCYYVCTR